MNYKKYLGMSIVALMCFMFILAIISQPTNASGRQTELEQRIQERSQEWQTESEIAARGRLAEERMAALNRQNNIDRMELQRLSLE